MSKAELAAGCFAGGFNCSQSVFSTYAPDLGLDRAAALKVAAAFGGGFVRTGETCGAVTGALMVIGLKYGCTRPDDNDAKTKTIETGRKFLEKFKQRNGSLACRTLLGCDLSTPEGMKKATDEKLFSTVCPKFVRAAAEILDEVL